jgi:hypothetical protein
MDTKLCTDLSVTLPSLEHSENISAKLFFIGITEIAFG